MWQNYCIISWSFSMFLKIIPLVTLETETNRTKMIRNFLFWKSLILVNSYGKQFKKLSLRTFKITEKNYKVQSNSRGILPLLTK